MNIRKRRKKAWQRFGVLVRRKSKGLKFSEPTNKDVDLAFDWLVSNGRARRKGFTV